MNWLIRQRSTYSTPTKHCGCGISPIKRVATSWTQADRDEYNRKTGSNLKPPQPEGGSRRDSYCARSAGIPKCKNPDKNGDCPNDIARRKWNC